MPLTYEKLFSLMEQQGVNKRWLRLNGIHANSVDHLIKNQYVSTEIVERLCKLLNCQPGDIMEYHPDETEQ